MLLIAGDQRWAGLVASDLDIPDLDPEPDPGSSSPPATATIEEWSQRWKRAWERAWDWYLIRDATVHPTSELLRELSQPDQPLYRAFPPFWYAEHGREGVDAAAMSWQQQLRPLSHLPSSEDPERKSLPALRSAWESGLETIVTLPYAGYFAHRISKTHLAVSNTTRESGSSYTPALATPLHPTVR